MLSMLQDRYLSVTETRTEPEFREQIVKFAQSLGFGVTSAMAVVDHSLTRTEFHVVDNTPASYVDGFNNEAMQKLDPVMQHCKFSSRPIIWDQETYVSAGLGDLWEEQAPHGIKTGIALAIHLPEDKHFFIGMDRSRPLTRRPKKLTAMVADIQLFAVHAQEAAFSIFAPSASSLGNGASLTPRELEALRWTMDGKTAQEVSEMLRISERTTVFHIQNAMRKLGCVSKHQAVLKAIRMRLLS